MSEISDALELYNQFTPDEAAIARVMGKDRITRQQWAETWASQQNYLKSKADAKSALIQSLMVLSDPNNIELALALQDKYLNDPAHPEHKGTPIPPRFSVPTGLRNAYNDYIQKQATAKAAAQKLGEILHAAHIGDLPGDTKSVAAAAADGSLYTALLTSGMSSSEIQSALANSKDAAAVQSAFAEAWAKIAQSKGLSRAPEEIEAAIVAAENGGPPVSTAEQNAYTEYRTKIIDLTTKQYQKEIARIDAKYAEEIKHGQAVQGLALSQKLKDVLARRNGLKTEEDFEKAVTEDKLGKYLLAAMYEDGVSKAEIDAFNESIEKWAKTNAAVHQARQQIEQAKADYETMKQIEALGEKASVAQRLKLVTLKKEIAATRSAEYKADSEGSLKETWERIKKTGGRAEDWAKIFSLQQAENQAELSGMQKAILRAFLPQILGIAKNFNFGGLLGGFLGGGMEGKSIAGMIGGFLGGHGRGGGGGIAGQPMASIIGGLMGGEGGPMAMNAPGSGEGGSGAGGVNISGMLQNLGVGPDELAAVHERFQTAAANLPSGARAQIDKLGGPDAFMGQVERSVAGLGRGILRAAVSHPENALPSAKTARNGGPPISNGPRAEGYHPGA